MFNSKMKSFLTFNAVRATVGDEFEDMRLSKLLFPHLN